MTDPIPGTPPWANRFHLFAGGGEAQIQFFYQAPATSDPPRPVSRTAMPVGLLVRMVVEWIGRLDPVADREILRQFADAVGAKAGTDEDTRH